MLTDKHIVIIAGSSGIGAEVAAQAAARGARVTITARRREGLETTAAAIPHHVEVAAFDATDRAAVDDFFGRYGRIDHLVSCVGRSETGRLIDLDEQKARAVFEHKIWAQLYIVRAAYPHIALDGSIVLTGGTSEARTIFPHFSAFSVVGNTALGAMVKGLAGELAPIRVNVVEPTLTDTPLADALTPSEKEALFARFSAKSPVGRVPTAREVAHSYIHAMESGLINGDRLRPDGGPTFSQW